MTEDSLVLCMKISQQKWIEALKSGTAWFGKIDGYITEAEKSGNNERGDMYEGVFARCKSGSSIINTYSQQFGDDLEIIADGDYSLLRRKSSRSACVFCLYGIKNSDLELIGNIENINGVLKCKFHYDIDEKMYTGFLQDGSLPNSVAGFYCSAGHLIDAVQNSLNDRGYLWNRKMVEYDIDMTTEFCINPDSSYSELFHKRKELSYQHEVRFLIQPIKGKMDGISVPYVPFSESSGNFAFGRLYIEGTAIVQEL